MAEENVLDGLKDVEEPDDFFEKILNEDIKTPTDDEDEIINSDDSDKKIEKDKNEDEENVEALKAKIVQLEKEAKGRLSDVVKSRQEKASFKSELKELKTAVSTLLDKRDSNGKEKDEEVLPLSDTIKPVEFGENDSAFVDLTEVKDAIKNETAKTRKEFDDIKSQREADEAHEAYKQNVQSVLSENLDVFGKAYDDLKGIFKDFNDRIIELQERTGEVGEEGTISQGLALELFSGSPEEEAFLKDHPGTDPTRIARAFDSKVDLRLGLKHIADINKIEPEIKDGIKSDLDEKIKIAKQKPGSLAGQENRQGDTSDLIERISNLSFSEFENLSDAEAAKIESMLLNEELKGD